MLVKGGIYAWKIRCCIRCAVYFSAGINDVCVISAVTERAIQWFAGLAPGVVWGALAALLAGTVVFGSGNYLQGVHWDSAIYAYHGKRLAETRLVSSFVRHKEEIAAQTSDIEAHNWPAHATYPEAFWHFTRFGNVIVMGNILSVFGSDIDGLHAASWLYHLMMAGAVLLSLILAAMVIEFVQPTIAADRIRAGVFISGVLYITSGVYGYLANNFVATPPGLFLLSAAGVFFMLGLRRRTVIWMVMSGGLAVLAYVVRMDNVWLYLSFMLALAAVRGADRKADTWWPGFIWAGATALTGFIAYYIVFYPLADPRLFVEFSKLWRGRLESSFYLLIPAGGLLWVGAAVGILSVKNSRAFQFALLWTLILVLPWIPNLLSGGEHLQTRHFSLLMPPLLVASTSGWLWLLDYRGNRLVRPWFLASVALVTGVLVCFSQPFVFNRVLDLPGLWRLQALQPYLYLPDHERVSYPLAEFRALGRAIIARGLPAIVVRDGSEENFLPGADVPVPHGNNHEALSVLRFFGPDYDPQADLAMLDDPKNPLPCSAAQPSLEYEPLVFCVDLAGTRIRELLSARVRIFRLQVKQAGPPLHIAEDERLVLQTDHYQLTQVGATD